MSDKAVANSRSGSGGPSSSKSYQKNKCKEGKCAGGGGGLNEIDDLFAQKKEAKKLEKKEQSAKAKSLGAAGAKKRNDDPNRPGSGKRSKLSGDRDDAITLKGGEWVDDGLGGKFNNEGYTGRKDVSGQRVFKAHLFNKKGFGTTKDCPFDCDCCYI